MADTVDTVRCWSGRALCVAGFVAWLTWLGWRLSSPMHGAVGAAVLLLELMAVAAALIVTAGLWNAPPRTNRAGASWTRRALPESMAMALDLDESLTEPAHRDTVGPDDTGEIAWARRGLQLLSPGDGDRVQLPTMREAAWSVVAVDGLRRMLFVVALVAVLFTGRAPFDLPPIRAAIALVAAQAGLCVGHWLLSRGLIRPGARLHWSMASIGAGLGDGVSRTGLPVRWMATMATMVVLNLAVSLRGLSDRWTHGLGAMSHDERVASMTVAFGLVLTGFVALRSLPQPSLGFYGATRRLEEGSTRRLALGATLAVAMLGFAAGVLPGAPT